jgi:hypothetical protein
MTKMFLVATVEVHNNRFFARQSNGQLWCLPPVSVDLERGDTIQIKVEDAQDQFCQFIRLAPELSR